MANAGKDGGDGKASPYGDRKGGDAPGKSGPNDFVVNPTGNSKGGMGSGNYESASQSRPQQGTDGADMSKDSVPSGGAMPFDDMARDNKRELGVGSVGNSKKPFRV